MIITIESRHWLTLNTDICADEQCWYQQAQESMKHSIKFAFLKQQAEKHTTQWWQVSQQSLSVQRFLWHQKNKSANDADINLSSL